MKRRIAFFAFPAKTLAASILAVAIGMGWALDGEASGYAEAVGLMKREQTLAEAGAGLLKTFARDDVATYARGIQLYALAQADFNALIETLKGALIQGDDLADSESFEDALALAVNRRVELTDFVDEKVLSQSREGTKSLAAVLGSSEIVKGAAELLEVLTGAGLDIWREYRAATKEQRQQINDQLDSLKWRSFDKVPALG
jgi:hypothetical protein